MEIALSDDQQLFRDTTRKALQERCPVTRVRELIDDELGYDPDVWTQGAELGWYAALVPEEHGGGSVSGAGLVDATIVAEEMGRMMHPGPFQATNIVAGAIAESGSPSQCSDHLPSIAAGELVATWAYSDDRERPVTATPTGSGYVLDGVKTFVHDAAAAGILLVTAAGTSGPTQFLVSADHPGVTVTALETLDLARRLASVEFAGVEVAAEAVLGAPGAATVAVEYQLQVALALQCAESTGATAFALEMTVEYAKERVAFGRPIGSYQALKHRMADHRLWLEGSFATTAYAARAVHDRAPDAAIAARVAAAHVGCHSSAILHDCIQIHGGIGMTWEHDLHLYSRRVISNEVLYGTPVHHQRSLVDLAEGAA
jgi:alkylation response protein AidB-like acyl-CoA dehydrogenase